MSTPACAECGRPISVSVAYFGDSGQVCANCHDRGEVSLAFVRSYQGLAWSGFNLACLSACFNPFLVISILAIGTSLSALMYPARLDEEDRVLLSQRRREPIVAALGLAISVGLLVLRLLAVFA